MPAPAETIRSEGMVLLMETRYRTILADAARLSDADLLHRVVVLAGRERGGHRRAGGAPGRARRSAALPRRGLRLALRLLQGALRLAEHAAYNRIEAARASRRFPSILDLLADGSLNLSTVRLIAPHLQPETFDAVVAQATGKSKREVEVLVARLAPRPDVRGLGAKAASALPAPRGVPSADTTGHAAWRPGQSAQAATPAAQPSASSGSIGLPHGEAQPVPCLLAVGARCRILGSGRA